MPLNKYIHTFRAAGDIRIVTVAAVFAAAAALEHGREMAQKHGWKHIRTQSQDEAKKFLAQAETNAKEAAKVTQAAAEALAAMLAKAEAAKQVLDAAGGTDGLAAAEAAHAAAVQDVALATAAHDKAVADCAVADAALAEAKAAVATI